MSLRAITIALVLAGCGPESGTSGTTGEESSTGGTDPGSSGTTSSGGTTSPTWMGDSTCDVCGPPATGSSGTETGASTSSTTEDPDTGSSSGGLLCEYDPATGTCMCDGVWSAMCEECSTAEECQPPGCFLGLGGCVCGDPGSMGVAEGVFCGCVDDGVECVCDEQVYPISFCDPWS